MDYQTPGMFIRDVDGITIVRLRSDNLSGPELAHLLAEIDGALARGARKVVLDLKYVRFAGSAALGMFIRVQKHINRAGGTMVLSHPEHIADLLRVSRTASLFKLAANLREAYELF
jgi:anti-anti-sigma factor